MNDNDNESNSNDANNSDNNDSAPSELERARIKNSQEPMTRRQLRGNTALRDEQQLVAVLYGSHTVSVGGELRQLNAYAHTRTAWAHRNGAPLRTGPQKLRRGPSRLSRLKSPQWSSSASGRWRCAAVNSFA